MPTPAVLLASLVSLPFSPILCSRVLLKALPNRTARRTFPRAAVPGARVDRASSFRASSLKHKVFLVDDSPDLTAALTELLEATGRFEVIGSASSEAEALAWLFDDANKWDLAVVDLMLQSGSGFPILYHCKKYHPGQVVVLSEFVSPPVAERCKKLGAVGAFRKSEFPQLLDFVSSLPDRPQRVHDRILGEQESP